LLLVWELNVCRCLNMVLQI